MTRWFYAGFALLSGMALACQVGFNSELRARMGHAIAAALVSFGVGTTILTAYYLLLRPELPRSGGLLRAPWWTWMGGVVGAVYVATSAAYARHLGATAWLGLVVTGQMLASLLLDHFGLIGFRPEPVSPLRLVGVLLLLAGVVLVLRA